MKKRVLSFVAATMMLSAAMPAMAAPLFPDVKDDHWAKDAVAKLAAQGLLEGYPDGTFKGDRAATRWEVAMIVARLLAKMEQAHATFATKAELDEVRKLANALKDELDALGVRVTNLEENVSRIDKRVSELERITFYGYVDTRGSMSTFVNTGNNDNFNGNVAPVAGSVPATNYNAAVGSTLGAGFNPATNGVLPVADYRNGRPLLNGVGFTARAVLGLRVRVSDDIDAGAEFSAFTSQGNQFIDSYWGVTAPWQSNTFTSTTNNSANQFFSTAALNSGGNAPFSRMTLDSFWVVHNPSQTKLILGSFQETNMDNAIYAGQWNPGAYGPRYLGGFGFNVSGKVDVSDTGVFRWEALGTRLGDNNAYDTFLLGADVEFEFDGGSVKANFARVNQDVNQTGVGARVVGGSSGAGNGTFPGGFNTIAAVGSTAPLQWVNTPGNFFNQSNILNTRGGAGSTTDTRPIPGAGIGDRFGGTGAGNIGQIGPQGMVSYGLSANYKWDLSGGDTQVYIAGNYAHSDYKPNQNSGYSVGGNAYRFEVGANLLDGDLDLGLQYLNVDATYDPFVLQLGGLGQTVAPMNLPNLNYYQGLYSLHDTSQYPHNRRGLRFNGQYRFSERRGLVWAKVGILDQVRTSLYDVRFNTNTLGAGVPNQQVLGFAPGFMDPVFQGYASPLTYGGTSVNSFDGNLNPLEDQRGKHTNWGVGASYKFDDPRVKVELGYERNQFRRDSNLVATLGGSQNNVQMDIGSLHGQVNWEASDKWTLRAGADYTTIDGHYDPAGRYNGFAIATGSTGFNNIDSTQLSPFLGFDFDVSANTQWNMDFRYYTTTSGTNIPTTNPNPGVGSNQVGFTNNPFEWNGWQVSTQFKVKF
ncbi:S-layer homology domain-containing protein [bacterium]|nr:S-layer homology domain-containing protein [bacterium]